MSIIDTIRKQNASIVVLGAHEQIIQSILDFDFLSGKECPSVVAIVTGGRKAQKYFFGTGEILIPCVRDVSRVSSIPKGAGLWMLNVQSGRRVLESTHAFFNAFPHALGGVIFAENVPEKHSLELMEVYGDQKYIFGPASVGLLVPGSLKLGAIGGIDALQIQAGKLTTEGSIAVGSTSGGMTNELITAVALAGQRLSFAAAIGGDRFPVLSLTDFFTLAEKDSETKAVVYFGELGGVDEYEIVELIKTKKFTKPLLAYIAGVIDEAFPEHVQFGHAKALVQHADESARAKRNALRAVGALVPDTFPEFLEAMKTLPKKSSNDTVIDTVELMNRQKSILSTRTVLDTSDVPVFVKGKKLVQKTNNNFVRATLGALIGSPIKSDVTVAFGEAVFQTLIDHGGHVSGAVNTMITARAGKDLVSSLVAGLLTVGPRFGGAINSSAGAWLSAVGGGISPNAFVVEEAKKARLIQGIGHKKYRVGLPDPRVLALAEFTTLLKRHPHYDFARAVEKITTSKNGSLILNIDGVIAALLLDILLECEGLSHDELTELASAEFFNAFFVIPRSVGFIAHFIEQKKNDEGLFRLPDELLFVRESTPKKKKGK